MTLPLALRKFYDDGPFDEAAMDQQWTDIEESVNELNAIVAPGITYVERTSNVTLALAHNRHWVNITSGTFSQLFDTAASLKAGWSCYLQNSGTGFVTLDPNASEEIDGLTSFIMYPGEIRLVQCNGVSLRSIVLKSFEVTFTASGNFIKPPGYRKFGGIIWSAGASGAKSNTGVVTGGGAGAGYEFEVYAAQLDQTHAFTIGVGGASVSGTTAVGIAGGNSQLIPSVFAQGAKAHSTPSGTSVGGSAFFADASGSVFGPATSAPSLYGGRTGDIYVSDPMNHHGAGNGAGRNGSGIATNPGTSLLAGDGGPAGINADAGDGEAPGGGGGGCYSATSGHKSGKGADGALLIRGVI